MWWYFSQLLAVTLASWARFIRQMAHFSRNNCLNILHKNNKASSSPIFSFISSLSKQDSLDNFLLLQVYSTYSENLGISYVSVCDFTTGAHMPHEHKISLLWTATPVKIKQQLSGFSCPCTAVWRTGQQQLFLLIPKQWDRTWWVSCLLVFSSSLVSQNSSNL